MLKQYLTRVLDGFLLGIGFSIPFFTAYTLVTIYTAGIYLDKTDIDENAPNYGLEISDTRVETVDGKYVVLGQITNPLSDELNSVYIEAEFFGKESDFLEKCTGYLSGELKASATRNFRIRCEGPEFEYSNFTVSVVYVSRIGI